MVITGREPSCDSDTSEDSKRKRRINWDILRNSKKTNRSPQKNQASTEMDDERIAFRSQGNEEGAM